ncbi:MAG: hypothetical protein MUF49_23730 [Oculatellaceae cyanobacterium Prado106]|nr:hypothetical protein [Oculatellaceae cyanobacterium Prado106]
MLLSVPEIPKYTLQNTRPLPQNYFENSMVAVLIGLSTSLINFNKFYPLAIATPQRRDLL